MILRDELLLEHSKKQALKIARWVGNDPKRFRELLHFFLSNEYRITQRSAMSIAACIDQHPELILPHLRKIIYNLDAPNQHDAVIRNTVRILQDVDVPKNLLGRLTNSCFRLLLDPPTPIAIKAFSMTVLYNVAKKEPELKQEIALVIRELLPNGSTGVRNRGLRVLKALEKL